MEVPAAGWQAFKGTGNRFVLRMANLQGPEQDTGIKEQEKPYVRSR